jgi:hypothetical protein
MKIGKTQMRQISHWAIFTFAAVTMALKIADVSAQESLKLLIETPECAQYSTLVTH